MSYEFVLPSFMTTDRINETSIHERMLVFLAERGIDVTEGGFAWDMTRPAAQELTQAYVLLAETIQIMFPAWAYSGWLDLHGMAGGIYRKDAVASAGSVTVTGVPNMTIPKGFLLATAASGDAPSIQFQTTEEATLADPNETGTGTATIPVACSAAGTNGNVGAGSVTLMVSPLIGVSGVVNASAITGGTDEESDDDYRERIMANDLETGESYVGSVSDFKRWAKSVDGVGGVVVIPTWNGAGTVKLVVVDENNDPANATMLTNVYNHIMSPDDADERLSPIGCVLTVIAPTTYEVDVSVTVSFDAGVTTLEAVTAAFTAALSTYFNEAADENVVRYTRIGSLLSQIDGVTDYSDLTINNGTSNIVLTSEQYPKAGTIGVTSA